MRVTFSISGLLAGVFVSAGLTALMPLACAAPAEATPEGIEYFERRIRPLLAAECYECHSPDKKVKGGLRLDTREGWVTGGDSGPSIIPGDLENSLVVKAVRYTDTELQMPPKKKLSPAQIADFEKWVKMGAPDPRVETGKTVAKTGINIEEGRQFWSYQPPKKHAPPAVKNTSWPRADIDRFILGKLEERRLKPVSDADRETLVRRAYFHLVGLPPTPEQIDAFVKDPSPDAFERLVDQLLSSPHYGERWGRHWLDVVRYAESVTLRGLVFKEAWRYRDYVIDAFNNDLPYNRFLQEQVAGDLLPAASLAEQRRQMTATTFLALGNINLEEQDKTQLRMDVVDEQLDTLGKAFLGQTIGCARCHDHMFDPIPTKDYYALAGILRNVDMVDDGNVSNWTERPLPMEPAQEAIFKEHEAEIARLQARIKTLKDAAKAASAKPGAPSGPAILPLKDIPGIVVDDVQAKKVGEWKHSVHSGRYIGDGYHHDNDAGKGEKTLTFLPELPRAGKYEVRLAYITGGNRAAKVPVTIFSADGEKTVYVNQQESPPIDGRFISLGQYNFELNGQGFIIVSTEGTKGHVIADAVQFLPLDNPDLILASAAPKPSASSAPKSTDDEIKKLEAELKQMTDNGPRRPRVMTVTEAKEIKDIRVHIRGSVNNQGDIVPRGFLQVASYGKSPSLPTDQSGRRELGEWLASPSNPLTARVMANRVWHWLFGSGLVRTTDNFGTTGETPSHPELLDFLAVKFMEEGWSVKKLVREIMLSRTWQLSSESSEIALAADPENRLLWRMNRQRLEAENIRDAMLSVSGQLDMEMGGSTIRPGTNADYSYKHDDTRRSIYAPVFRNALPELLEVFDFADPSMVTGSRTVSTVAPQALFLMNHPFVDEQARHAATRLLSNTNTGNDGRVERAYRLTIGRRPTQAEKDLVVKFISAAGSQQDQQLTAWTAVYKSLFASIDFRYIN